MRWRLQITLQRGRMKRPRSGSRSTPPTMLGCRGQWVACCLHYYCLSTHPQQAMGEGEFSDEDLQDHLSIILRNCHCGNQSSLRWKPPFKSSISPPEWWKATSFSVRGLLYIQRPEFSFHRWCPDTEDSTRSNDFLFSMIISPIWKHGATGFNLEVRRAPMPEPFRGNHCVLHWLTWDSDLCIDCCSKNTAGICIGLINIPSPLCGEVAVGNFQECERQA